MLLTLDLNTNLLIQSAGFVSALEAITTPYGSAVPLRIYPVRNGAREALPAGFQMTWTGKATGDYGGTALVYADTFTLNATTGYYEATVAYDGVALEALLDLGEALEQESVTIVSQLAWRISDSANWQPSQNIAQTIHNSVWRDEETTPLSGAVRAVPYYRDIIGLTGGGSTKLDGIATVSLPARTIVMLVINDGTYDVRQHWMLYAGTDAEDAPGGIVRPDDYATTTNEKVWKSIA